MNLVGGERIMCFSAYMDSVNYQLVILAPVSMCISSGSVTSWFVLFSAPYCAGTVTGVAIQ